MALAISYGIKHGVNGGEPCAHVTLFDYHFDFNSQLLRTTISSDDIDRLIAARDGYHREVAHRGRPIKESE